MNRIASLLLLALPLTPDTRHLIDDATLALVKPTAFLVNPCPGPALSVTSVSRLVIGPKCPMSR